MSQHLSVGTRVRIGIRKFGTIVGPSDEPEKYIVEYYPGPGSGHHHADELTVVDELPLMDWNHKLG